MTYFFIWNHGQVQLEKFLDDYKKLYPNLKFTHESNRKSVTFLNVYAKRLNGQISTH